MLRLFAGGGSQPEHQSVLINNQSNSDFERADSKNTDSRHQLHAQGSAADSLSDADFNLTKTRGKLTHKSATALESALQVHSQVGNTLVDFTLTKTAKAGLPLACNPAQKPEDADSLHNALQLIQQPAAEGVEKA